MWRPPARSCGRSREHARSVAAESYARAVDADADRSLRYLKERFPDAQAWQISAAGRKDYRTPDGIRVAPAAPFLRTLV